MNKILTLALFVCITAMVSCGESPVYSMYQSVDNPWQYEKPLVYEINVASELDYYNLVLALSFKTEFGYENLYTKITTEYPDQTDTEDIVSFDLTDGSGSFLGDCSSSKCKTEIFLQENFKFKSKGKHIIRIYQNSRDNNLVGIIGAEMRLLNAKKK